MPASQLVVSHTASQHRPQLVLLCLCYRLKCPQNLGKTQVWRLGWDKGCSSAHLLVSLCGYRCGENRKICLGHGHFFALTNSWEWWGFQQPGKGMLRSKGQCPLSKCGHVAMLPDFINFCFFFLEKAIYKWIAYVSFPCVNPSSNFLVSLLTKYKRSMCAKSGLWVDHFHFCHSFNSHIPNLLSWAHSWWHFFAFHSVRWGHWHPCIY